MKRLNEVPSEVRPMVEALAQLPEDQQKLVAEPLRDLIQACLHRKSILQLIKDAIDQLRVDMKYLIFDLEATRRERDGYRRQLETQ